MLSRVSCVVNRSVAPCRALGTASFGYNTPDPDYIVFPRESAGLSYDLNWSLADDNVTPKGAAFRNASTKELIMYSSGKLSASKAIDCGGTPVAAAGPFATDDFAGHITMSLDDYEAAWEQVCGDLSHSQQLFIEDAAVGATREAQVRLRVISDSAEYALYMRNLLVRTPLYHPEAFPRPIVVYLASNGEAAFIGSDVDTETAKATVVASGKVSAASVREEIAHVAGLLMDAGGYRSQRGGGARVDAARKDGNIEWYMEDRYYVAPEGESHPDLLRLRASASVSGDKVSLTVDGAGAADQFAAHDVVWTSSGLVRMWDGVSVGASHGDDLPAGAITFQGATTHPLAAPGGVAPHPSEIIVSGDLGAGLTDSQAEKLHDRVKSHGVKVVKA